MKKANKLPKGYRLLFPNEIIKEEDLQTALSNWKSFNGVEEIGGWTSTIGVGEKARNLLLSELVTIRRKKNATPTNK